MLTKQHKIVNFRPSLNSLFVYIYIYYKAKTVKPKQQHDYGEERTIKY